MDRRLFTYVSWAGVAVIALAMIFVAVRGDWVAVAILAAFLIGSVYFVAFENRLPAFFDMLFVIAAIINAAGWVWSLFDPVWGYDEIAHFYTSFAVTLSLGYLTFHGARAYFREHLVHFAIIITSFGVTLGAWWEVAEWLALLPLADIAGDLVADTFGALLAAVIATTVLRKQALPANSAHQPDQSA